MADRGEAAGREGAHTDQDPLIEGEIPEGDIHALLLAPSHIPFCFW